MKRTDETKLSDDPMVKFILAHPTKAFVLSNDEKGRSDPLQCKVFEAWMNYWKTTDYLDREKRAQRLRTWPWMRSGFSKFLTLPCVDPDEFEIWRIRQSMREAAE